MLPAMTREPKTQARRGGSDPRGRVVLAAAVLATGWVVRDYRTGHLTGPHNDAAFPAPGRPIHADGQVSGGEIGHIHADGSLHVVLDPADAAQAIEHCWGQLHPAEGRAAGLPPTYVLLYSPRNPDEVAVVEQLLDAAATHMTANHQASVRSRSGGDR